MALSRENHERVTAKTHLGIIKDSDDLSIT
jgi:hypothetical protein